jgi:anti-sigma28 factor (negative regulator of flagellin synthesis)
MNEMKKDSMRENEAEDSFEKQKIELIRLRIQNGFYENSRVLENVVKEILDSEIKRS